MYKFVVVTDSDRASGFRLAGAEVIEAANAAEARGLIPPLLYKDDIGIVAVNEEYMLSLDEKVMDRIEKMHRPLIIPAPLEIEGDRPADVYRAAPEESYRVQHRFEEVRI